jgi:hypothetical protein
MKYILIPLFKLIGWLCLLPFFIIGKVFGIIKIIFLILWHFKIKKEFWKDFNSTTFSVVVGFIEVDTIADFLLMRMSKWDTYSISIIDDL